MNYLKTKRVFFLLVAITSIALQSCGGVPEETPSTAASDKVFAVAEILTLIAEENDITRTLYTKGIVGAGKKQGLKFDEDWQDDDVEAGPLPALFLRGISSDIRKSDIPLGLYLGSDFPINASNKFQGKQAALFKKIKATQEPQHFFEEDQKLYTSMFADLAVAAPCVNCHNDHENTTKTDWKLGDVMGATTWQYPSDSLSYKEAIGVINAYRNGTKAIYNAYLKEISEFKIDSTKPTIGNKWPSKGFYLPTAETFVDSVRKLTSYKSLEKLLLADNVTEDKETEGLAAN